MKYSTTFNMTTILSTLDRLYVIAQVRCEQHQNGWDLANSSV